ncbi:MAG: ATP-binding protein [Ktedonobacteraceae bacterium]
MNEQQRWQEQNTQYLSASLAWLRLRLERLAKHEPVEAEQAVAIPAPPALPAPVIPATTQTAPRQGFFRRRPSPATSPVPAPSTTVISLAAPAPVVSAPDESGRAKAVPTDEEIAEHARHMSEAEAQNDALPALAMLSQRLDMTRFEQETLLLCIAMELDTRIAALCARAQDDANKPYPTFALALALFDEPGWDIVSPERPLRYWRLIEINQSAVQPLTVSSLRADERIVNYVKGLNYLDDRLVALIGPLASADSSADVPPSQQRIVEQIVRTWQQATESDEGGMNQAPTASQVPVIQLPGADVASKQAIAAHAAAALGRHLYRVPIELLPAQTADIELFARLWQRESLLLPLALYLDMQDVDSTSANDGQAALASRFLARSDGIFFLGVREMWPRVGRASVAFDVEKPTTEEQASAWTQALGEDADDLPGMLAAQFNLNLATIEHIAASERRDSFSPSANQQTPLSERLWDACLLSARPSLDTLAQRLALKVTWDDLVLPAEETDILHQIAAQVQQRNMVYEQWGFADKMNRGLGINALFAGVSGTGKTMAAEVLANSLRLNLYRIDLSAVVSKYIGETEKNLRRLFDAAEDGGAILFFDEADALFGKRSEVKDSHDRYANIEINYLLQRIEAYRGLAILATNMRSALDTAFLRRLRFVVTFPFPGVAERKRIWQRVFPPDVPLDTLDFDRLARLELTGGSTHNVALNAAFMAAHNGSNVTMALVLSAARAEFRKLERPINEADFRLPVVQGAKK